MGSPKDFEIGRVAIEVKSRRGGATPSISITSEDQLDESGVDFLFLYVCEIDRAQADNSQSFTVTEVAGRVRDRLYSEDPRTAHQFDTLVTAAGFDQNHDYSHSRWIEGSSHIYHVTGDFPRITGYELRQGISRVRYSVSLSDCQAFEITGVATVPSAGINGEIDAHRYRGISRGAISRGSYFGQRRQKISGRLILRDPQPVIS